MALGERKHSQSLALLLLLAVVVVLSGHVGALTVDDLYPFGPANGDKIIKAGDDLASDLIPLPYAVPVFGDPNVKGAYLNLNGALHMQAANEDHRPENNPFPTTTAYGYSMVAAFWTDLFVGDDSEVDDGCNGHACTFVAYRAVGNADLLATITSDIRGIFPQEALAAGFTAESALIATWFNVSQCCDERTPFRNTFQAVIAFNTRTVFVGLLYPTLTFGGPSVQAGFNLGDGIHSFRLPSSFSGAATFDTNSNVGQAGKWWFGLDSSNPTIGTFNYLDAPIPSKACQQVPLYGDTGVDACGNQQAMDWDLNNDGAFDDATGTTRPVIDTQILRLTPGTYPISARVRSAPPCPGAASNPLLSTALILTGTTPTIFNIRLDPANGNPKPMVGEAISITLNIDIIFCNNATTTIDCGADSIAGEAEGSCRYSTPGVKNITVTIMQHGLSTSGTTSISVVEYKQACSPAEYPPNGRAVGQRGCPQVYWESGYYACNYPAHIKPSTRLWVAFASSAAEDAAVIRRLYGNRTMIQALRKYNSKDQANLFASEAAAALLNALTLAYPQCPLAVKLKFRHALYRGVSSTEARTVYNTFLYHNNAIQGCTLPFCQDK